MGLNCKPGELCRIVEMPWTPEANDHFVTTVCLAEEGYVFPDRSIFAYMPGSEKEPSWLVRGHRIPVRSLPECGSVLTFCSERVVGDRYLRPIRPGDLTQEEVDALYLPQVIKQRDPEAA